MWKLWNFIKNDKTIVKFWQYMATCLLMVIFGICTGFICWYHGNPTIVIYKSWTYNNQLLREIEPFATVHMDKGSTFTFGDYTLKVK